MMTTGSRFAQLFILALAVTNGAGSVPFARASQPLARQVRTAVTKAPSAADCSEMMNRMPLSFREDGGRFVAQVADRRIAIENGAATFQGLDGTVRMTFAAAKSVAPEGTRAGVANYLVGNDASKWRTNVPTYARVRLEQIAPGVDLVFYGSNERPEYDFVVAPGADPSAAVVSFHDAIRARIDENGDLVVTMADGEFRQLRPVAYQETSEGRRIVTADYRIDGGRVGVRLGAYDPNAALVIDPAFSYGTYLGGNADDRVEAAVTDASGNLYVVGSTLSSNFPVQGQLQDNQSGMDGFVTKINAAGTAFVFSTYIGGRGTDYFNDVAVDGGHIYLAGATGSGNYPTFHAYSGNLHNDGLDAVLTVLNLSGTAITYSTLIGGGNNDIGNAVAVDIHGNAYLAGEAVDFSSIFSSNFPTKSPSSLPPFQTSYGGGRSDAFVCKFDPDQSGNSSLVYSTLLGGSEGEGVEDIAVDDFERAYVCGYTESTNFDRLNAVQNSYGGSTNDGFVTKFNADGTTVFYSSFFGGNGIDEAFGIALDTSSGSPLPVVVGHTTSTNIPTQLAIQPSKNGAEDCFAFKLVDSGTSFVYSTYFGGPGNDAWHAVAVDSAGNSFFTGFSNNTYPLLNPIPVNGAIAATGVTVTKLSPAGSLLLSTCVGAGSGEGVGFDQSGNLYVAGTTSLTNFPVTPGAPQATFRRRAERRVRLQARRRQ